MNNTAAPGLVAGLAELAPAYRGLLCDVWGVVHDGAKAHTSTTEALMSFRDGGGTVVLITNAPRPKADVVRQLDGLGVPRAAYDDVITSGDAARHLLQARPGVKLYHVGPERDLPIYFGLPVKFADEADCELVSCTGLFDDENETPQDYDESFADWQARGVPMLCVNPDIVVERGGETIIVGKPYAPIYDTALSRFQEIAGSAVPKAAVLAIGDGIDTDIRGAFGQGIDVLFVTGGIHAAVFGPRESPDLAKVHAFLATAGLGARALTTRLVW